jgi:hypothetical protein
MLKSLCAIIDGCTCKKLCGFFFGFNYKWGKGVGSLDSALNKKNSFLTHAVKIRVYICSFFCPKLWCALVFTGNTFQDLPGLRETADNTERYIT